MVTQDDVTGCALFLASDYSKKITGQVLHIDCGMSSSRLMPAAGAGNGVAAVQKPTRDAGVAHAPPEFVPVPDSVSTESHGVSAVRQFLEGEFPNAKVRDEARDVEGRTGFTVKTADGELCFQIDTDLLSKPPGEVVARLREWGLSAVLLEAGGLVVRATATGLSLAESGIGAI